MKKRTEIIKEAESFRRDLAASLSEVEVANGWTPQSQDATLKLLNEIVILVKEKKPLPLLTLGRGLDHWGITKGAFFERACSLSNNLRNIED